MLAAGTLRPVLSGTGLATSAAVATTHFAFTFRVLLAILFPPLVARSGLRPIGSTHAAGFARPVGTGFTHSVGTTRFTRSIGARFAGSVGTARPVGSRTRLLEALFAAGGAARGLAAAVSAARAAGGTPGFILGGPGATDSTAAGSAELATGAGLGAPFISTFTTLALLTLLSTIPSQLASTANAV